MMLKTDRKTYLWLLGVNLFISAFTFGGGYVVVPMVRRFFVWKKRFFTEDDLMNMAAVAQSTPGAIAINLSALAGYRVAGLAGLVISCIAAVTPPLVILGAVSAFYSAFISNTVAAAVLKGMEAGVAAIMVDLIIDMCAMILKERSAFLSLMIPAAFAANFILHINVALILIVCCGLCIARVFWRRRENG
ncbi:MAG: chromate transporter [Eubacteriales bacterium]|nr:chromate transporter [Eubacteriales bacterium]